MTTIIITVLQSPPPCIVIGRRASPCSTDWCRLQYMLRQFFSLFMPRLHWHPCRGLESRAVTAFSQWLRALGPSFMLPSPATHCRSVRSLGLQASSLEQESPASRQSFPPHSTSHRSPVEQTPEETKWWWTFLSENKMVVGFLTLFQW